MQTECPLPSAADYMDPRSAMVRVEIARQAQAVTATKRYALRLRTVAAPLPDETPGEGPPFTRSEAWRALFACVLLMVLAYAVAYCARQLATL